MSNRNLYSNRLVSNSNVLYISNFKIIINIKKDLILPDISSKVGYTCFVIPTAIETDMWTHKFYDFIIIVKEL